VRSDRPIEDTDTRHMLAVMTIILPVAYVAWMPLLVPSAHTTSPLPRCHWRRMVTPPSPPPAVDLRFAGREQPEAASSKYGKDPRAAGQAVTPDATFTGSGTGAVGILADVAQLQAALNRGSAAKQVVVIKFVRKDCLACASTRPQFREMAATYMEKGQFYEVDFDDAKPFCRSCGLKFVPSSHIYAGNSLKAALPMGKKSWDAFVERLTEVQSALG